MIKKLLLLVIIGFTAYETWIFATEGFERNFGFANLDVPSYNEVVSNKEKLNADLKELETLNSTGIENAVNQVEAEIKNYETKKQEYDMLALTASEEEIAEANKIERYLLDYLWIRVGNYAADNNVKFKMTPNSADATLVFDITGSYISTINFIYDLENDMELNFDIEGITIQGAGTDTVKSNFRVEGINVVTSPDAPEE